MNKQTWLNQYAIRSIWKKESKHYQIFRRCCDGLLKLQPNAEEVLDMDYLYFSYAECSAATAVQALPIKDNGYVHAAYIKYSCNKASSESDIDILSTMIHEFGHILDYLTSTDEWINNKFNIKYCHGPRFRECCHELAKVICNEEEYYWLKVVAFDGYRKIRLDDLLIYNDEVGEVYIQTQRSYNNYQRSLREWSEEELNKFNKTHIVLGSFEHINEIELERFANAIVYAVINYEDDKLCHQKKNYDVYCYRGLENIM